MRMRTRSRYIMAPETSQTIKFRARSFIRPLILVNKPYWYNIFVWASFLQVGKKN